MRWPPARRSAAPADPERSLPLRVAVLVATVIAMAAVGVAGLVSGAAAVVATLLAVAGSWFSARRARPGWLAPLLATVIIALLVRFLFGNLGRDLASTADLRAPLAGLLLAVATVRACDLRLRRDLLFALAGSGTLLAVAGVVAQTLAFGLLVAAWGIAALVALTFAHRSDLLGSRAEERPGAALRPLAALVPVVGALGLLVFAVMPAPRISTAFLSSVLPKRLGVGAPGSVSNPARDSAGNGAGFGYFGFTDRLDTGVRGRPNDELVMRVRASAPDFWRGQTFDRFDGRNWTISRAKSYLLPSATPVILPELPDDPRTGERGREFVQTYFLEKAAPNLVFQASRARAVYFPQATLFELVDGTIRAGQELVPGTSYTVVSDRPNRTERELRANGNRSATDGPQELRERYTQLPDVPERVRALAAELTAGAPSTYDQVRALEGWLGEHTRYSLDIPPLPAGADTVDRYLFVDRVGFCEQIASSLVVMMRSIGVPARLAVGYVPGERNPLSGMYEVRARDAHAWAEVYFPGIGWQAFDPTAEVPLAGEQRTTRAGSGLLTYLRARLGSGRALIGVAVLVALGVGAAFALRSVRHRFRRSRRNWSEPAVERLDRAAGAVWRPRRPAETLDAYAAAAVAAGVAEGGSVARAVRVITAERYADLPATDEDRAEVEEAIARVEGAAKARRRRPRLPRRQ